MKLAFWVGEITGADWSFAQILQFAVDGPGPRAALLFLVGWSG